MAELSVFLLHFSLSQLFICCLLLLPQVFRHSSVLVFCLLLVASGSYLLGLLPELAPVSGFLWWFVHIGSSALVGCFWLVAVLVFAEGVSVKNWQYLLACLPLFMSLTLDLLLYLNGHNLMLFGWGKSLILLVELVMVGHALAVAMIYWRSDLVQQRRYLRAGILGFIGFYFLVVIVSEQLFLLQYSWLPILKYSALALLVTTINYLLFQYRPGAFFAQQSGPVNQLEDKSRPAEVEPILAAMQQQKLYQQEGLTISDLAGHLSLQEYKLRQLINKQLNYRNFNDFLNHYRIAEVAGKLLQGEHKSTPVLTLALESGFRSLSSFNKAFKQTHGMTPTEFRRNQG